VKARGRIVQLSYGAMTYNQKKFTFTLFLVLGDPIFNWQKELVIPELD